MAIIVTTWSPSTCKCVIEYEWDSEHPHELRMHRVVRVQHCGGDHPDPVLGEHLEGSSFHEHHVVSHAGKQHWDQALKDNPHWPKRKA